MNRPSGERPGPLRERSKIAWHAAVSHLILSALFALNVAHAEEFGLDHDDYRGLGESLSIFEGEGLHYEILSEIDFALLGPEDAVLLLHIGEIKSARGLIAFIERGGALLLADEGKSLDGVYARFGFRRGMEPAHARYAVDGFEGVYLAPRFERHALSEGVRFLIVDRPRPFYHPSLSSIFTLDEDEIIVAVGRLGAGELIALGDSSIFINQLARLSENRRFLQNLGGHLADRYARLLIVRGPGVIVSSDATPAEGLSGLREALASIRKLEIDGIPLYIASLVLLLALTLMLGAQLHGGSLFQGPTRLGFEGEPSSAEWRLREYQKRGADLREPIASLRRAVYQALERSLGRPVKDAGAAREAVEKAGLSIEAMGLGARFFTRLDEFALSLEGGRAQEAAQRASRREFIRLVEGAEALLAQLETRETIRGRW